MKSFKRFINEEYLNGNSPFGFKDRIDAGGAYGHMSNLFDVNFKFSELKDIISKSLQGKIENVTMKTDGQNLMFTYKDGRLMTARNKSHIKNFGENAMTADELALKFKNRGGLEHAYNNAVNDLNNAISKLSEKQIDKIFAEGKKFMSIEVIHMDSQNVVNYFHNEIMFHGTIEYDIDGNPISENKEDGRILAGMIKQINQNKQKEFDLMPPKVVKIPEAPDFKQQKKKYFSMVDKILKKYSLNDTNTIEDYKKAYFKKLLDKKGIDNDGLLNRWAMMDKSYAISQIKKDFEGKDLAWILDFDKKKHKDEFKKMMLPVEYIALNLGATVLSNVKDFVTINPNKAVKELKSGLEDAIKQIEKSGNPKLMDKLKLELGRFEKAGGMNALFPEEGIVFNYKGNLLKLTGTFAPLNQIMGLLWQL